MSELPKGARIRSITFSTSGSVLAVSKASGLSLCQTHPYKGPSPNYYLHTVLHTSSSSSSFRTVSHVAVYGDSALYAVSGDISDALPPDRTVFVGDQTHHDWLHVLNAPDRVTGLFMTSSALVVRCPASLYIYDIYAPIKPIHVSRPFIDSCDIAVASPPLVTTLTPQFIAYPISSSVGKVLVFDPTPPHPVGVTTIDAHQGTIQRLTLGWAGPTSVLATASTSGTLIRIFILPEGKRVATLRRGTTSTTIQALRFSPTATHLAAVSGKGTLHVFTLPPVSSRALDGTIRRSVSEWIQERRDTCNIALPTTAAGMPTEIRWVTETRLVVASTAGQLAVYDLDVERASLELMSVKGIA